MIAMEPSSTIKTRLLIISDTHGLTFPPHIQLPPVDVAIHCGDLTEHSKLAEFETAIKLLEDIPAKLKLVIAGNHDFSLDDGVMEQKIAEARAIATEH